MNFHGLGWGVMKAANSGQLNFPSTPAGLTRTDLRPPETRVLTAAKYQQKTEGEHRFPGTRTPEGRTEFSAFDGGKFQRK